MNKNAKNKIFLTDNKEKGKYIQSKNKIIYNNKDGNNKENNKEINKENKKENKKENNNEEKIPDVQIEQKEELPINNTNKKIEIKKM